MRTTETPRQAETPRGKNPFTPQDRFATAAMQRNIAFGFAIFVLILCVVCELLTIQSMQTTNYVFAIDGSHTIHAGPLETMDESDRLFKEVALEACQVALNRSPAGDGMDLPELGRNIYRPDAFARLAGDIANTLPDMKTKNLHYKPEINQINVLLSNGIHYVGVSGNCVIVGAYEGTPIAENKGFRCLFSVVRNGRIDRAGEYPYVVADYKVHIDQ
jgi:hypothetical protein